MRRGRSPRGSPKRGLKPSVPPSRTARRSSSGRSSYIPAGGDGDGLITSEELRDAIDPSCERAGARRVWRPLRHRLRLGPQQRLVRDLGLPSRRRGSRGGGPGADVGRHPRAPGRSHANRGGVDPSRGAIPPTANRPRSVEREAPVRAARGSRPSGSSLVACDQTKLDRVITLLKGAFAKRQIVIAPTQYRVDRTGRGRARR